MNAVKQLHMYLYLSVQETIEQLELHYKNKSPVRYFAKKTFVSFANTWRMFANNWQMFVCTLLHDKFSTPCIKKTLRNTAWQTYMLRACCEVLLAREPVAFVHTYVRTSQNFKKPVQWQFEVIIHTSQCQLSIFTLLNIQCTYTLLEIFCCGSKLLPVFRPKWPKNR